MSEKKSVIIIGGGFGGLASAILLAKDGYAVTLLEKNEAVGGRASVWEQDGFRFDMGPSWYLMPDVFKDFFERIGENVEDHLELTKLAPSYRIFYTGKDPSVLDISGDLETDIAELEKIEPGVRKKFLSYLKKSEYQYKVGIEFCYRNFDSIFDFFSWDMFLKGIRLKVFSTFKKYVQKFFKHPKIQKLVQYPLVFLGTAPDDAPALYNIMSHVDFNMGVFYPQGGIYAIVEVLEKLARQHGVQVKLEAPVAKILTKQGSVSGVRLASGDVMHADIVVCNADMAWAETTLLEEKEQTYPLAYWKKKTFAPSAFLLYMGIEGEVKNIDHHTLLFSEDWSKNFGEIFDKKILPDDPSLYLCTPSKTDKSVAPSGSENMFILVPIPSGITISDTEADAYEKKVLELVEESIGDTFVDRIKVKRRFHVKDFSDRYNAFGGTALGLSHTLTQTAIMRPNNISKKVKNLYYVGHNTNPGIGMPMVLISALLVQERIKKSR